MGRTSAALATLLLAVLTVAVHASEPPPPPAADPVSVVPKEDAQAVLHNPDVGWVLYENYPLDQQPNGSSTLLTLPNEDFAGVGHVALMFSWADIEREPGRYDFARADYAYDYWKKRGKQIQLRMSTESLLWWGHLKPPAGQGVPDHVLAKIPADRKQRRECEGIGYTVVDARDPAYLAALEQFLAAVAGHFAGSRPVTLVDLRGFGLWGEWHTGYRYASVDDRRAALVGVIDRYAKAFPNHHLSLSYSYDPDSPKALWDGPTNRYDPAFTKTYDEFLRFSAFDHALAVPNVTFRRDGAGGAVHSNERRLCEQAFRTRAKGPMMSEFVDGYATSKKGRKGWVDWKVDDALSLHPNYVNLLGWQGGDALAFVRERRDLFEHGLRRMGYRLVPTKVTYPGRVRIGEAFRVDAQWVNRGVGRAMRDYNLRLALADEKGKVVASVDAGAMNTSQWIDGETHAVAKTVTFRDAPAGEYELRLAVTDPATGGPIQLPLADARPDGSYAIGRLTCLAAVAPTAAADAGPKPADGELVQVAQDFAADPGWENMNNRVVAAADGPTIRQDFGWRPTSRSGDGAPAGEVGGTVFRTRTPAWYGMKLPRPLSLNDPMNASGRLVVMPIKESQSGAYFGFFNAARQGWRPWSSLAVRVGENQGTDPPAVDSHVDYMTSRWRAGGFQTVRIPADGKPHRWTLAYDPDLTVPTEWPDPRLRDAIGTGRRAEPEILAEARKHEPAITESQLKQRLEAAANLGLIEFHTRRGVGWEARKEPGKVKGRITFRFDDGPSLAHFLDAELRGQPAEMDRFGIYNMQLPGRPAEFYLSDLIVNGRKLDLSKDPGWDGSGNRVTFPERDFHAKHDFGFGPTNHAGQSKGEIGGTFWRTEAVDPLHGYYADDVGRLTLDDPISFSGSIAFTDGATDAGMFFGYFNRRERLAEFRGAEDAAPMAQSMGITIDGPTRVGYYFSGQVAPTRPLVGNIQGPVFVPDGLRHRFTFAYDPKANDGRGRIVITLGDQTFKHDLTKEQRAAGSTFDRFGMMNVRRGGKHVTVYLDDLTYTARRRPGERPDRHEQAVTKVPYPEGGRKH